MEGTETSVTLFGIPAVMNDSKLRLFIEKRTGTGSLKDVQKKNDQTILIFKDKEGGQSFLDANIEEITFGGHTHKIEIMKGVEDADGQQSDIETSSQSSGVPTTDLYLPPETQTSLQEEGQKSDVESQEELYRETNYWSTLQELPAEGGTICALAQNVDLTAHIQNVIMHFESKKRSSGGPVKSIINMIDGLLIVFKDENHCKSCLGMRSQILGGNDIVLYPKLIPTYHERTLLVEGVGMKTSDDDLYAFLQRCSEKETSPKRCIKQEVPRTYVIEYGDNHDPSENATLVQNINSKLLEGNKLKARLLLRTDCLRITDLPHGVSKEEIKVILERKGNTVGGQITRIDRIVNQTALVYFASFIDAERVYENSHLPEGSVTINNHPVKMHPYYHSLSKAHENILDFQEKEAMKPYEMLPKCDEKVFKFVRESKEHVEKMKSFFKPYSSVEIKPSEQEDEILIVFIPNFFNGTQEETDKGDGKHSVLLPNNSNLATNSQDDFETKCCEDFSLFISNYTTTDRTFDCSKLEQARSCQMYAEIEQTYEGDENDSDFIVRWKEDEPTVVVTGIEEAVENTIKRLEDYASCTSETMSLSTEHFRILVYCGIVNGIQEDKNVKIKIDEEKSEIVLIGPYVKVKDGHLAALQSLNEIEKRKMNGLDENIIKFLSECRKTEMISRIQSTLRSNNILAAVGQDGEDPYIAVKSETHYHLALKIIEECFVRKLIKTNEAESDVVKTPDWTSFLESLHGNGHCGVYIAPNGSIILVGIMPELKNVEVEIKRFLGENVIKRIFIHMSYGKARFLLENSLEFSQETREKREIECGLSSEGGGGVFFKARKRTLDEIPYEVKKLRANINEVRHTLNEVGIAEYYKNEEGRETLSVVEKDNKCVILAGSREHEEWLQRKKQKRLNLTAKLGGGRTKAEDFQEEQLDSYSLHNPSVVLEVWRSDITKHKCDAIVIASNPELTLLPGGDSGLIKNQDMQNGNQIQNELNKIMKDNIGNVLPGDAVATSAGNSSACKKIIHAVGPRWKETNKKYDPDLVLKACISKTLKEVENAKLKSVAFPAISCGVFGGEVHVCIPLIVEAVEEYFKDTPSSCIRKIHFVEKSRDNVLKEFLKCLKKYKEKKSQTGLDKLFKPLRKRNSRKSSKSGDHSQLITSFPTISSSLALGSCTVFLDLGDIADQSTDVTVNVTDTVHLNSMANGPAISRSLERKAGLNVQIECGLLPTSCNAGTVHETGAEGLACKKLYHAVVCPYNPQNASNILQSIVFECLRKAETSGLTSIAFPAIATGGYEYPPQLVANVMKQEILKFSGNNLTSVTIVLHPNNTHVINVFKAEFESDDHGVRPEARTLLVDHESETLERGLNEETKEVLFQQIDDSSAYIGLLTVSVFQGDMLVQQCDVITSNISKSPSKRASNPILRKAGPEIRQEIYYRVLDKNFLGDFSAVGLPCKRIIFFVDPKNPKELKKKIIEVLEKVEDLDMVSVCLPALGTDIHGVDSKTAASVMRSSIEKFIKSTRHILHLKAIDVVISDHDVAQIFRDQILDPHHKKGLIRRLVDRGKGLLAAPQSEKESTEMFFYSTNQDDINKGIQCISDETKKVTQRQVITDDAIERLTEWEKFEIREVAKRNNIKITDISDRYLKRLALEGLTKQVIKARGEVEVILMEFHSAETCASFVTWQKKTVTNKWKDYSLRSAYVLEKSYKARKTNSDTNATVIVQVPEFIHNRVFHHGVDLNGLDGDHQGGKSPRVRRKAKENVADIPASWDDMKEQPILTITLSPSSKEYKDVVMRFHAGLTTHTTIISIERIQNVSLYKQYVAKKDEVTEKLKTDGKQIERRLFHGTGDDDKILQHGFDRSYAGKNATRFGKGVYFATDASYSINYASPNSRGLRRMFLADVITGEYCTGRQSMTAPPQKLYNYHNDVYDSVVDNEINPSIFVIFKDASAYPTYRITFT